MLSDGQEIPDSTFVPATTTGVPHADPFMVTVVPPPLVLPTAMQNVVDGQAMPVVANPSCWTAHVPEPLVRVKWEIGRGDTVGALEARMERIRAATTPIESSGRGEAVRLAK
ncbi:MAG: hypothetical protein WB565_10320 [Acidimicrobiales bacterium]